MPEEILPEYPLLLSPFEAGYIAGIISRDFPNKEERPIFAKNLLIKLEKLYLEMRK